MRDVLSHVDTEVLQDESLYGNDDVLEVTQSTFPGKKDSSVWLVEFYAPCAPLAAALDALLCSQRR